MRNNYGEVKRLTDVVSYETKPALFAVTRYNRQRSISIFANPAKGTSQDEALKKVHEIAKEVLPSGYNILESGNSQLFRETSSSLFVHLYPWNFCGLYGSGNAIQQLHSSCECAPGAALQSNRRVFRAPSHASEPEPLQWHRPYSPGWNCKKNSILLVDFTNERRKAGLPVREALLEACPIRLRPILMTSAATIAGAVPEALSRGAGSELIVPMAVTVIGGVFLSTILTLFVVPCFYELMGPLENHSHDKELREALGLLGELPTETRQTAGGHA